MMILEVLVEVGYLPHCPATLNLKYFILYQYVGLPSAFSFKMKQSIQLLSQIIDTALVPT